MKEIIRCTRCVMDNASDSTIRFDGNGACNYCAQALAEKDFVYFPGWAGEGRMESLVATLKEKGRGKEFDCVMGLSGGLDSSYLLYVGHRLGLRILGVHVDDGFDTDICKANLRKLAEATGIRCEWVTPDPKRLYALSKAYMRAGVANLAAPQDSVLFAEIYSLMRRKGIRYFLSGGNWPLECILQQGNTHTSMDLVNMRDIHRRFGEGKLDGLPLLSAYRRMWDLFVRGIQSPRPLNYLDYNRNRALDELKDFCGFSYYGGKHLENKFTAFTQLVWLPQKFGVDKRTSHLSSMIISGQITRQEALEVLDEPLYAQAMMMGYVKDIREKLEMPEAEYEALMAASPHEHSEYRIDPILRLALRLGLKPRKG